MCGIAGVIRIHEAGQAPHPLEAIPEAWLDVLDEGIKHRGPDGQGRFRDRATRPDGTIVDVAFVHRRLSILDHEGGHQPMVHDGERLRPDLTYQPGEVPKLAHEQCPDKPLVAVVFNGCIYNQHELRTELTQQGAWFETDHSDTEVLVHGWRAWESKILSRLEAMFSFALWNRRAGTVSHARDYYGEKPHETSISLHHEGCHTACFASELGAILRWRASASPDVTTLASGARKAMLSTLASTSHALVHAEAEWNIYRLRPSHWKENQGQAQRFLPLAVSKKPEQPRDRSWSARPDHAELDDVEARLRNAVHRRLETDVQLACFLSGGVDSSLIASYAHEVRPDLRTFTVRMPSSDFDESRYAAQVASKLGVDHTALECDADPAGDLVRLIETTGEPLADSSWLPTYWVCQAAKSAGIGVALTGDGADELFSGYERYRGGALLATKPRLLDIAWLLPLPERNPKSRWSKLARLARAQHAGGFAEIGATFGRRDTNHLLLHADRPPPDDVAKMMGHMIMAVMTVDRWIRGSQQARYYFQDQGRRGEYGDAAIGMMMHMDLDDYLPNDLLVKVDRAAMISGIETRAPFLDTEVAEAVRWASVRSLRVKGQRKGLLRAIARQYLPASIVDRPKQGFAIPIGQWFRDDYGGLRQLLYDHLESTNPFPGLAGAGVEINMGFVRQMLLEHDAAGEKSINPWHGRDHSQRLYMLLVLSIWAKWLHGLRPAEPSE